MATWGRILLVAIFKVAPESRQTSEQVTSCEGETKWFRKENSALKPQIPFNILLEEKTWIKSYWESLYEIDNLNDVWSYMFCCFKHLTLQPKHLVLKSHVKKLFIHAQELTLNIKYSLDHKTTKNLCVCVWWYICIKWTHFK